MPEEIFTLLVGVFIVLLIPFILILIINDFKRDGSNKNGFWSTFKPSKASLLLWFIFLMLLPLVAMSNPSCKPPTARETKEFCTGLGIRLPSVPTYMSFGITQYSITKYFDLQQGDFKTHWLINTMLIESDDTIGYGYYMGLNLLPFIPIVFFYYFWACMAKDFLTKRKKSMFIVMLVLPYLSILFTMMISNIYQVQMIDILLLIVSFFYLLVLSMLYILSLLVGRTVTKKKTPVNYLTHD